MLRWPSRAARAIRQLFEPLQEIDVYVEDIDDEPFYRCLLNRAVDRTVLIARVFGLGGRDRVLEAAAAHDFRKRRALFIVDGDLTWVRGEPSVHTLGVHQHDAYCVENLIVCEAALVRVLGEDAVLLEADARNTLGFVQWCAFIEEPLVHLTAAWAAIHKLSPCTPTVGACAVGNLCSTAATPVGTQLDPSKVLAKRDEFIAVLQASHAPQGEVLLNEVLTRLRALPEPLLAVSGKHLLLPLIGFHLQRHGCRISKRSLRMRLCAGTNRDRLTRLRQALGDAAAGQTGA